jgi:3-oxoadipate enol-lactonase
MLFWTESRASVKGVSFMPIAPVNGTHIYYEDHGPQDAPAVVFSHSLFFTSRMFHHQVKHFRDTYRVICYDHRGQGQSAKAPLEQLDMDTLAEDALALLDHLGITRCHFVGNSMGGFIALRLAARHPERLLTCTVLGSSGEEEHRIADFQPVVDELQTSGGEPVINTLMYIMFGDTSLSEPSFEEERSYWREYMSRLDASIGDAAYQVVHRKGVLHELADCTVPVLAISGTEDHAYSTYLSENIVRTVKNGVLGIVPKAGHSVSLERPDDVNRLLERHFTSMAE